MAGTLVLKIKLIAVALTTLTLGFYGLRFALVPSEAPIWQRLISGFLGGCSCLVGLVNLWMSSMRASDGNTLLWANFQVLMIGTIRLFGVKHMKKLTAIWSDPHKAEEEYLNEILTANSDTVYAKDFGLQGVTSLRELREKHQLTGYERYMPYADRMAKGEQGVLTRNPPSWFGLTHGTTGRAKMFPVIDAMMDQSIMTLRRHVCFLQLAESIDTVGVKEVLANSYVRGIPPRGNWFGGTEGIFGLNLWPRAKGKDEFVLLPHLCVFEFIAEDKIMEDQPDTLFIDELQVGGVYEIAFTHLSGLYRYRLGNVIRVTRFHYETPVVQFMYSQMLNVNSEKLDQKTVQRSIEAAVGRWPDVTLQDYAVAESTLLGKSEELGQDHRPFYLIFIELDEQPETLAQNKELLDMVDEELCLQSFTYNSYREKGRIAPPLVHVVQSGTFERLHDFILENSTTTANQYKVPRILRTEATLKLMLDSSIAKSEFNN